MSQTEGELEFGDAGGIAKQIREAIGVGDYEKVEVLLPQFDRTDGKKIVYKPSSAEELDKLKTAPKAVLLNLGLRMWDGHEDKQTWIHWIFPVEWYDAIPDGYIVTDIFGNDEPFMKGKTDDDRRYGALSFGFIQGKKP